MRAAAKAYHNFVNVDIDKLLREPLQIAYMTEPVEEPKKRTPRAPRRRRTRAWNARSP